jgi:hypothetical protein
MDRTPVWARWERWKYLLGIGLCLLLGWIAFVHKAQVPLLSLVDLGFHELGHLVTRPLPEVVMFMAGSAAQIAVPTGLAVYFLIRRDRLAGAMCLAWAATCARDVSVYIADAPFQRLELIGGEHDWAFILGEHWHAVDKAGGIAAAVRGLGMVLLFAGFCICAWYAVVGEERASEARRKFFIIDTANPRDSLPSHDL